MTNIATILAIGTANPPASVYQTHFADEYFRLTGCDNEDLKSKLNRICEKSMIQKRQMGHIYQDEYKEETNVLATKYPSLDSRKDLDTVEIPKLGAIAATRAIDEWGQPKSKITHLIVHSTSGIKMPGVDFELMKLLELDPCVKRCMMYFYGCMAGASILRIAKDMAENNAGSRVLVICSEVFLSGMHEPSDANLVATAIFGEGAAAIILGSDVDTRIEHPLFQIVSADQGVIPGTEDFITSNIREKGLVADLSKEVPSVIANNIMPFVVEAVRRIGVSDWDNLFWIVHPGGVRIVNALEEKLNLKEEKLKASRTVMREYGNMSSPTLFFILDEMRKSSVAQGLATTGEGLEWGILFGFGPGITLETMVLRSCPLV